MRLIKVHVRWCFWHGCYSLANGAVWLFSKACKRRGLNLQPIPRCVVGAIDQRLQRISKECLFGQREPRSPLRSERGKCVSTKTFRLDDLELSSDTKVKIKWGGRVEGSPLKPWKRKHLSWASFIWRVCVRLLYLQREIYSMLTVWGFA